MAQWLDTTLCELMGGYHAAIGFPRARDALDNFCVITQQRIQIPTNCCPALLPFASKLIPIDPDTGLAPVPVQLYGYRKTFASARIEIDPLMTGALGEPFADSTIISFGYSKTIDIGGGGAILTNDKSLAKELQKFEFFPNVLRNPLIDRVSRFHEIIMEKKKIYEEIEDRFYEIRLKDRPVIPWRFMGKDKCPLGVRNRAKELGYKFGRNYPPLPGVTDEGARRFAWEVVNIWR